GHTIADAGHTPAALFAKPTAIHSLSVDTNLVNFESSASPAPALAHRPPTSTHLSRPRRGSAKAASRTSCVHETIRALVGTAKTSVVSLGHRGRFPLPAMLIVDKHADIKDLISRGKAAVTYGLVLVFFRRLPAHALSRGSLTHLRSHLGSNRYVAVVFSKFTRPVLGEKHNLGDDDFFFALMGTMPTWFAVQFL
ncbi:hypothetical protein R3P38DRAFT_2848196, partial [Favolaschia claudopus]